MPRPLFGIVQELRDRAGVRRDVVRLDVRRSIVCGDPRLLQVERDDGQLERHVLHRLVHCRDVVQWVERVRAQPEIRGREHLGHDLVRDPTGEGDPVRDPELFCELDQICSAVSFAHQDELDVVPSRTRELGGGVEREIDAVLRAHDTEVRAQVPTAAPPVGIGFPAAKAIGVRARPNDRHVARGNAAPPDGRVAIRVVRRDHVIRDRVGRPLEEAEPTKQSSRTVGEP